MNNELYHWKYIKREKVNGKWKYIYSSPDVSTKKTGKLSQYINGIKRDVKESKERSIKRHSSVAKEFLKDRLGYDELERYEDKQRKANKDASDAEGYAKYVSKENNNAITYNKETDRLEYKSEGYKEYVNDLYDTLSKKRETADKSQKEARKALYEFFDTPIGKLDKIDGTIDSARTWLARTLEDGGASIAKWLRKRNNHTGFIR